MIFRAYKQLFAMIFKKRFICFLEKFTYLLIKMLTEALLKIPSFAIGRCSSVSNIHPSLEAGKHVPKYPCHKLLSMWFFRITGSFLYAFLGSKAPRIRVSDEGSGYWQNFFRISKVTSFEASKKLSSSSAGRGGDIGLTKSLTTSWGVTLWLNTTRYFKSMHIRES